MGWGLPLGPGAQPLNLRSVWAWPARYSVSLRKAPGADTRLWISERSPGTTACIRRASLYNAVATVSICL